MSKLEQTIGPTSKNSSRQIPIRSNPFFVIYNHRRSLRAKALKLLKH